MDLLGSKASMEAYEYFVRRVKGDERLMNIIGKNNVNIDDILYLPTDDGRQSKIVAVTKSLAQHLFSNTNYTLFDIEFNVREYTVRDRYNRITDIRLHVHCYAHYDIDLVRPPLIDIDDKVKFKCGAGYWNTERVFVPIRETNQAEFTVESLMELVSVMISIMHKLLDENEQ